MPNFLAGNIRTKRDTAAAYGWTLLLDEATTSAPLFKLSEVNGYLIRYAFAQGFYYSSNGGRTWTFESVSMTVYSVAYGAGKWVVSGTFPYIKTASNLGGPWTTRTVTAPGSGLYPITFADGIFMAVARETAPNTGYVVTSPDGITWTQRSIPQWQDAGMSVREVLFHDGTYFYAYASTNDDPFTAFTYHFVRTIDKGLNWTTVSPGANDFVEHFAYNRDTGRIFAGMDDGATNGPVKYSDNQGSSWAWCVAATVDRAEVMAFGDNKILIITDKLNDPEMWYSTDDGVNFSEVTPPYPAESLNLSLLYHRGRFYLSVRYAFDSGAGTYTYELYEWETY